VKDQRGVYYFPYPTNKTVRMYVRENEGDIEFRLWNDKDPQLWEEHGWAPFSALVEAFELYDPAKSGFNPKTAYDINVAKALLKEKE
jgi:hypothetical protein